eukprot:CAMPEP_0194068746 /NCGR_PEP_ID=MMETSP0009_2-20130614/87232_1 /TAXON_ID=210454 /ORGANISM="Grammatophora oceanica, Strain CCMP 410" /LENGTH=100 /DNA_ID=CAMNT_0038721871 /DNA_START=109 /DNA_END=411 /DNA_ORIENTATION=+
MDTSKRTTTKNGGDETCTSSEHGISKAASQRMCQHMNDDHAVSVYGMVRSMFPGASTVVTDTEIVGISFETCDFTCKVNGKSQHVSYPFHPPLSSAKEAR